MLKSLQNGGRVDWNGSIFLNLDELCVSSNSLIWVEDITLHYVFGGRDKKMVHVQNIPLSLADCCPFTVCFFITLWNMVLSNLSNICQNIFTADPIKGLAGPQLGNNVKDLYVKLKNVTYISAP